MVFELEISDIAVIIAVFQLTIFIGFLLFSKNRRQANTLLALFLTAQWFILTGSLAFRLQDFFYAHFPHVFYIGLPFYTVASPMLYFYVKSLAYADFNLTKKELPHFIFFFVVFSYFAVAFYLQPAAAKRAILDNGLSLPSSFPIVYRMAFYVQILIYNIASLRVLANYRSQLKDNYSSVSQYNLAWLQFVIFGFIFSWLADVFSFSAQMLHFPWANSVAVTGFVAFFIFFNVIFFKGLTQPQIFSGMQEKAKYQSSNLSIEMAENYLKKLNAFMEKNKPFLDPDLTLKDLAEDADIPQRYLSQVINEHLKQNFYDLISRYRIEESKKMLKSSSHARKTVLEIMYDVGFNSKSAFNLAFKKYTGMTPSQFKNQLSH